MSPAAAPLTQAEAKAPEALAEPTTCELGHELRALWRQLIVAVASAQATPPAA